MSTDAGRHGSSTRGRLRIYLGYAPGAGTTCALLGEGRQRAEHGTDVVVAGIETQGRPGTEALLAGLEVISPPTLADGGTTVEEIDPGAILARSPRVALVDDLGHGNAPGARHATRWQEVEDLLAAGIDVISTAGLAHLESLSDVVAKITGFAPGQTVPDPVIRAADEVQLVDVAPEVLAGDVTGPVAGADKTAWAVRGAASRGMGTRPANPRVVRSSGGWPARGP